MCSLLVADFEAEAKVAIEVGYFTETIFRFAKT
jgi:hypothetical protein